MSSIIKKYLSFYTILKLNDLKQELLILLYITLDIAHNVDLNVFLIILIL